MKHIIDKSKNWKASEKNKINLKFIKYEGEWLHKHLQELIKDVLQLFWSKKCKFFCNSYLK